MVQYIVNKFPKISETFILDQISNIIDLGNDVCIISRFEPRELKSHELVEVYGLKEDTFYLDIPRNKLKRILSAGRILVKEGWKEPVIAAKSLNPLTYGRDALSLQLLHSSLSYPSNDADIVHCHFGPNGNFGALLKQQGKIENLIVSFHGSDIQLALREKKDLYDSVFQNADKILVNSKFNMGLLEELGADRRRLTHHPISLDINDFSFRWESTNPEDVHKVKILSIGRLVREKGYQNAIAAVATTIGQFPEKNFEYRIVGSGAQETQLREKVREEGLEDTVSFLGQLTMKEVREELARAHLFLLASNKEGFGKVLLEAQASGLPVVSTTAGGIPEAVDVNSSAFLAPPGDIRSLTEKLTHVINMQSDWEMIGRNGRAYVNENYNQKEIANDLHDLYSKIA